MTQLLLAAAAAAAALSCLLNATTHPLTLVSYVGEDHDCCVSGVVQEMTPHCLHALGTALAVAWSPSHVSVLVVRWWCICLALIPQGPWPNPEHKRRRTQVTAQCPRRAEV